MGNLATTQSIWTIFVSPAYFIIIFYTFSYKLFINILNNIGFRTDECKYATQQFLPELLIYLACCYHKLGHIGHDGKIDLVCMLCYGLINHSLLTNLHLALSV